MYHLIPLPIIHTSVPSTLWEMLILACVTTIYFGVGSLVSLSWAPRDQVGSGLSISASQQASLVTSSRGLSGTWHRSSPEEAWEESKGPPSSAREGGISVLLIVITSSVSFVWGAKERRKWPKFRSCFEMIWDILSLQVGLRLQNNSYTELTLNSSENFEAYIFFKMKRRGLGFPFFFFFFLFPWKIRAEPPLSWDKTE